MSHILQVCRFVIDDKGKRTGLRLLQVSRHFLLLLSGKFDETEHRDHDREFVADRPFMFYVEDDTTGALLISGIVNNPVY